MEFSLIKLDMETAKKKLQVSDKKFSEITDKAIFSTGNIFLITDYFNNLIALAKVENKFGGATVIKGYQNGNPIKNTKISLNTSPECYYTMMTDTLQEESKVNNIQPNISTPKLKYTINNSEKIEKIMKLLKENHLKGINNLPEKKMTILNEIGIGLPETKNTQSLNETLPRETYQQQINNQKWKNELYSILF